MELSTALILELMVSKHLETVPESGIINYTIRDTDSDGIKNYLELDSDNDLCFDNTAEAGFLDPIMMVC
jgi:hypothetical protein